MILRSIQNTQVRLPSGDSTSALNRRIGMEWPS